MWADIESYKSSSVPGVKSKWMSEVPGIFEFRMKEGFKIKIIDEQSQLGIEFEKFILKKIKSFANSERMIFDFNASKISGLKSDNKSSWLLIYCSILLIAALSSWQLYELYKSFTFETQNPHIMADLNCVVQKGCNVEFEYNGVIVSRALSAREWSGIDRDTSLVKIVVDAENPYRFKMLKDLKADKSRVVALLVLVVMLGSGLIFIKKIIRSRIDAMETLKKNFEKSSAN